MSIIINKDTERSTLEANFPISISEKDCTGKLKPVVILNYMQDLAAKSIDKYDPKFSCEELLKNGLGWFLIRYRVEFDKELQNIKELKIQTECRGCQKMNSYRDFEVFDKTSGERILRATSSWLIVDINTKSVINTAQQFPEYLRFTKREDDLTLRKLKSIENFDEEKSFTVRYDDLDINNHVNNTIYIAWALEALNYDFRSTHSIKNLDIYYKHEAKYGEDILSQVKYDLENKITEHVIKTSKTGEELCLLKVEYN